MAVEVIESEARELNLLGARVMGWRDAGIEHPLEQEPDSWDAIFTNVGHGPQDSRWWFMRGLSGTLTTLNRWNPCEDANQALQVADALCERYNRNDNGEPCFWRFSDCRGTDKPGWIAGLINDHHDGEIALEHAHGVTLALAIMRAVRESEKAL